MVDGFFVGLQAVAHELALAGLSRDRSGGTHKLECLRGFHPNPEKVVGDKNRLGQDGDDDGRWAVTENVDGLTSREKMISSPSSKSASERTHLDLSDNVPISLELVDEVEVGLVKVDLGDPLKVRI